MTKTLENFSQIDQEREEFLDGNDRGLELTADERKKQQRELAQEAFLAIALQVKPGHNID